MTPPFKLLSRDDFREGVFARDKHACVLCGEPAQDAHHILERRLWPDGGYYLENGASVCGPCHIKCEQTLVSVEQVREAAQIARICVPDTLYEEQPYDKWGNPIMDNGKRSIGPLFFDDSVQKVLNQVLDQFEHRVKSCKTMHLPWSPGIHSDDRIIRNLNGFLGEEVVFTKKMDGENTMMYWDYFHARSITSRSHPSQSWAKAFHAQIQGDIPPGWRLNGENVYAQHSIKYNDLDTFFYGFGLWNEKNVRLDWDEMLEWFELLGVTPAPVLWRGVWDEKVARDMHKLIDTTKDEGFVVTTVKGFPFAQYHEKVAKWVRKDHVQTNKHWKYGQAVIPNKLKG